MLPKRAFTIISETKGVSGGTSANWEDLSQQRGFTAGPKGDWGENVLEGNGRTSDDLGESWDSLRGSYKRGPHTAERGLEPAGRALELVERASELAGRA